MLDRPPLSAAEGVFLFMRRTWLIMLSWCVGFAWAVVLIMNAFRAHPPAAAPASVAPPPQQQARIIDTRGSDRSLPPIRDTFRTDPYRDARGIQTAGQELPAVDTSSGDALHEQLPDAQQGEANYTGNVSTQKFHRLSCRYANCKNCTMRFATRDEALKAGFRPCGNCDP